MLETFFSLYFYILVKQKEVSVIKEYNGALRKAAKYFSLIISKINRHVLDWLSNMSVQPI